MRTLKKKPIQIYIEPKQDNILVILSKKNGVSKAEIIRKSIDKLLEGLSLDNDPAIGLIGLGNSGKQDLSSKHDHYLVKYSSKKK